MGGGGERGEQGTETAGRLDDRKGDLDKRTAATTDNEDERAGQDGGWATLLLSCLPPGLETCYITTPLLSIDLVKISKTKLATLVLNLVTLVQ